MIRRAKTSQNWQNCTSPRLIFSLVVSLVLILGQAMPAMAGFRSDGSGVWVEICGDGAPYLVELEQDEDKPSHKCTHCPLCLVWSGDGQVSYPVTALNAPRDHTSATFSAVPATLAAGPEQYWSLCRGPPISNIEKHMTHIVSLTAQGAGLADAEIMNLS